MVLYLVYIPYFCWGGGGGWLASYQILKKEDLTGSQFLEEVAEKKGVTSLGGMKGGVAVFT